MKKEKRGCEEKKVSIFTWAWADIYLAKTEKPGP